MVTDRVSRVDDDIKRCSCDLVDVQDTDPWKGLGSAGLVTYKPYVSMYVLVWYKATLAGSHWESHVSEMKE